MKYTPQQEKAISVLDKNLQIIACADSGKTQVISQRVVNIVHQSRFQTHLKDIDRDFWEIV